MAEIEPYDVEVARMLWDFLTGDLPQESILLNCPQLKRDKDLKPILSGCGLQPLESEILRCNYGLGEARQQNLAELASLHQVSASTIRVVELIGLAKIRQAIREIS